MRLPTKTDTAILEEAVRTNDTAVIESYRPMFEETAETITEFGKAITEWLQPQLEAVGAWVSSFGDWLYQIYLENGAPYGNTKEGSNRWWEEHLKVDPEKAKAEREAYRAKERAGVRADLLRRRQGKYRG